MKKNTFCPTIDLWKQKSDKSDDIGTPSRVQATVDIIREDLHDDIFVPCQPPVVTVAMAEALTPGSCATATVILGDGATPPGEGIEHVQLS